MTHEEYLKNFKNHTQHHNEDEDDWDEIEVTNTPIQKGRDVFWKLLTIWFWVVGIMIVVWAIYLWVNNKNTAIADDTTINDWIDIEYNWTKIKDLQDEITEQLLIQKENNKIIKEKQDLVNTSISIVREKEEEQKRLRQEILDYVNNN